MNDTSNYSWNTDDRIDRLVDGELPNGEYRELLQAMEDHPDGWRICALTFLENQALTQEFGSVHADEVERQSSAATAPRETRKQHINWSNIVAVAASFMIAFALGIVYHSTWSELETEWSGGVPLASDQPGTNENPAVETRPTHAQNAAAPTVTPLQPQGFVPVNMTSHGPSVNGQVNVPYYDWSVYNQLLAQQQAQTTIPPEVQRALRQAGQELRRNRQWMTVPVDNNRRVLVPVEQFEIVPVGRYQ